MLKHILTALVFLALPFTAQAQILPSCSGQGPDCTDFYSGSESYDGVQIFNSIIANGTIISPAEAANAVQFVHPGFPDGSRLSPGSIGTVRVNPGVLFNLPTLNGNFFYAARLSLKPVSVPGQSIPGYPPFMPLIMNNDSTGHGSFYVELVSDGNQNDPLTLVVSLQNPLLPQGRQGESFTFSNIFPPSPFTWQQVLVSVYTTTLPSGAIPANTFVVQAAVFTKGIVPNIYTVQQQIGDPGLAFKMPFAATMNGLNGTITPLHYIIGSSLTPSVVVSPITGDYTYYPAEISGTAFPGGATFSGNMAAVYFNAGIPVNLYSMPLIGGSVLQNATFINQFGVFTPIPTGPSSSAGLLYPGQPEANIFLNGSSVPTVSDPNSFDTNSGYVQGLGNTQFDTPTLSPSDPGQQDYIPQGTYFIDPADPAGDPDGP